MCSQCEPGKYAWSMECVTCESTNGWLLFGYGVASVCLVLGMWALNVRGTAPPTATSDCDLFHPDFASDTLGTNSRQGAFASQGLNWNVLDASWQLPVSLPYLPSNACWRHSCLAPCLLAFLVLTAGAIPMVAGVVARKPVKTIYRRSIFAAGNSWPPPDRTACCPSSSSEFMSIRDRSRFVSVIDLICWALPYLCISSRQQHVWRHHGVTLTASTLHIMASVYDVVFYFPGVMQLLCLSTISSGGLHCDGDSGRGRTLHLVYALYRWKQRNSFYEDPLFAPQDGSTSSKQQFHDAALRCRNYHGSVLLRISTFGGGAAHATDRCGVQPGAGA